MISIIIFIALEYLLKYIATFDIVLQIKRRAPGHVTTENMNTPTFGEYPIIAAAKQSNNHYGRTVIKECLKNNVNVCVADHSGRTALMYAVMYDYTNETVAQLCKHAAPVNVRDKNGMTALMYAAKYKHADAVKTLLNFGANKNKIDKFGKKAQDYK